MDEGAGGNPFPALAGGVAAAALAPRDDDDGGGSSGEASGEGHEDNWSSQGGGGGGVGAGRAWEGGGGYNPTPQDTPQHELAWVTACFETRYSGTKAKVLHLYFVSTLQYSLLRELSALSHVLNL